MSKVYNIICKLCHLEVMDTKDWVQDQQCASYHKTCYEEAIRMMARCITEAQNLNEMERRKARENPQDDPDHETVGSHSPAIGVTAGMLGRHVSSRKHEDEDD